eukprot:7275185-Alexandrium_andersonii.AAC.1
MASRPRQGWPTPELPLRRGQGCLGGARDGQGSSQKCPRSGLKKVSGGEGAREAAGARLSPYS